MKSESRSVVSDSLQPHGLQSPWNSPGQSTGVGNLSLLQRIFPTQGSNPGLLHCRCVLYHLSHKGSPRIPEWIDLSLLQQIFSNRRLLHCRQILYRAMSFPLKHKIMPFAATWMQLEIIIVSKKDKYVTTCTYNLKYDTNEFIYETEQTWFPRGREQLGGWD